MARRAKMAHNFEDNRKTITTLLESTGPDGKKYTYAQILECCKLPADRDTQRLLSNWLNPQGLRRRCEYKHKREPIPASETLPGMEPQPETFVDIAMLRDIHRKMYDCMVVLSDAWNAIDKAIQDLHAEWWRMCGAGGIKPGDANE